MIFWGLLSIIQLTLLPGWLITWRWKAPGWLNRVLVAFGLSLLFNYFLVLLLVAIGWFNRSVILGLVGIEFFLLLWVLYDRSLREIAPRSVVLSFPIDLSNDNLDAPKWLGIGLFSLVVVIAVSALVAVVSLVLSVNPGVFNLWDDLVSFHRWATSWYEGIIPRGTHLYPQLIPANWALAYQITGNSDIQFFVKAVMGVFPIAVLLTFVDLFYRSRKAVFLIGLS